MAEFTGERVIPGQVDPDLWNEHLARYAFASRLCRHKRVLDMGCGAGYGTAELARYAWSATGIDLSQVAVEHAREHYNARNLRYLQASCTDLPFPAASFDLVISYEVIEHIPEWRKLIEEARRVLKPGGQFIVSTPNRLYYAESRKIAGPNPYHDHEFEFEEFRGELESLFPSVSLFLQNHGAGIVFQPVHPDDSAEVSIAGQAIAPEQSHFFLAVCALGPQLGAPTFVYLPTTANLLREREMHISRLEQELDTKNAWLEQARSEHAELLEAHREIQAEIKAKNIWAEDINAEMSAARLTCAELQEEIRAKNDWAEELNAELSDAREICSTQQEEHKRTVAWAENLNAELKQAGERIVQLQDEAVELVAGYEQQLSHTEQEKSALASDLAAKIDELARCVEILHQTEKTVEERTAWAKGLDSQLASLSAELSTALSTIENYKTQFDLARGSRWLKIGNAIGVGPRFTGG
jgi:ubiquinone biosynthesis O-methyltransferase